MKRIIAILTAFILTSLAGCSNVEYQEQSVPSAEPSVDIYEQLESELPTISVETSDGETAEIPETTFTIVTDSAATFYPDESVSGTISAAVAERNTFLLGKYGADISVTEVSGEELYNDIKTAYESGLEYCDMLAASAEDSAVLYTMGLLEDMNTLPNFNVENSYFDATNSKALATNNSLYMLPDPTALVFEDTYVMFYNRNLTSAAGYEDLETVALQGKWTWDKFNEVARAASTAYDKHSANLESDIFGFAAYHAEKTYPIIMFASCGEKLIENTYKNPVTLAMTSDEVIAVAEKLESVYNVKGKYPLEGNEASTVFENGRIVFFCNTLDYFYALRDGTTKGSEYGFLPLPKLSEEQESYHCLADTAARVISVPKTIEFASDSKRAYVSAVISATCAAGGKTMKEAFVESYIASYLNNNAETLMLETICESVTFDFSYVYGSAVEEIAHPTITAVADYLDFGSKIASTIRQGKKAFEAYCEENFS